MALEVVVVKMRRDYRTDVVNKPRILDGTDISARVEEVKKLIKRSLSAL